jgi:hypothetical protein
MRVRTASVAICLTTVLADLMEAQLMQEQKWRPWGECKRSVSTVFHNGPGPFMLGEWGLRETRKS